MSVATPVSIIQTHRLLLRPVQADDFKVAQAIHGDPQTNHYNPQGAASLETTSSNLFNWVEHWKTRGFGYWAVCDKEHPEQVLGFGGLQDGVFGTRTALNLYFRFAPHAWGKGYASEMVEAALHLAFLTLERNEVIGLVRPDNLPSRRALERARMIVDGELDDVPGQPRSLLYSLSAERYLSPENFI
ncbi:GNAT family acetyltransferase [Pseudomonas agarici]|uniref:GNAT family acetyltransferase n=1 Tax=Pseudomonas agarici TaxID=46677 RepID=A0A0X1SXP1_PSEAA|nr:GNAT family N-acetyltransferase [Pseudomonas agarici]AMB84621.1 GNAT family acetyltransferase [Pseudomonas agarici]